MKSIITPVIVAVLSLSCTTFVHTAAAQEATSAGEAAEPHEPGIAEIMAHQQMRHIKLWYAGHSGNWPLADYEIEQLKDGFDDLSRRLGGGTVEKMVGAPLSALEKAIDAKNSAGFVSAFDKLTEGCNACHRTLDHAFIAIRRPALLPYSDQFFTPQKR